MNIPGLLTTQINELRSENSTMREKFITLKNKVKSLEANVSSSSMAVSQFIYESTERECYSTNLIANGISESTFLDLITRISGGKINLTLALLPLSISLPVNYKVLKLGKIIADSSRHLKIVF